MIISNKLKMKILEKKDKINIEDISGNFSLIDSKALEVDSQLANSAKQVDLNITDAKATDAQSKATNPLTQITAIPSSKFDVSSDNNKVKLINLSDEVKTAMAGTTPINTTPALLSINESYLAPEAVTVEKVKKGAFNKGNQKLNLLPSTLNLLDTSYFRVNGSLTFADYCYLVNADDDFKRYGCSQVARLKFATEMSANAITITYKPSTLDLIDISTLGLVAGDTVSFGAIAKKVSGVATVNLFMDFMEYTSADSYLGLTESNVTVGNDETKLKGTCILRPTTSKIKFVPDTKGVRDATGTLFDIIGWYIVKGNDICYYYTNPQDGIDTNKYIIANDKKNILVDASSNINRSQFAFNTGVDLTVKSNDEFINLGIDKYLDIVFSATGTNTLKLLLATLVVLPTLTVRKITFGGYFKPKDTGKYRLFLQQYNASDGYIKSSQMDVIGQDVLKYWDMTVDLDVNCTKISVTLGTPTIIAGNCLLGGYFAIENTSLYKLHTNLLDSQYTQNASKWGNKIYNSVGDSISVLGDYQMYADKNIGFASIINNGISGSRIASVVGNANDGDSLINRWDSISTTVDLMTIFMGINDYNGSVPIGTITSTLATEFYGAYKTVIEGFLTKNPLMRLVLITPQQRTVQEPNTVGFTPLDYRNAVIKIAEKYGLPCLDMYTMSGVNALTGGVLLHDGLHPTDLGYRRIGSVLSAFLEML